MINLNDMVLQSNDNFGNFWICFGDFLDIFYSTKTSYAERILAVEKELEFQ
ncbi:MAG TPA: hypothetical protein VIO64_06015 [Pseudobacteroides sp.]|uniref:hypothetical protein n=1 Tax=Pseudobacteroides sp. TaxID=1968840 RepID=UPI002F930BA4